MLFSLKNCIKEMGRKSCRPGYIKGKQGAINSGDLKITLTLTISIYISSLRKREGKLLKNLPLKGLTHVGNSSAMQGMSKCGHKFKMGVGEYATGLFSSVKSVSGYSSRRAKIHSQPT